MSKIRILTSRVLVFNLKEGKENLEHITKGGNLIEEVESKFTKSSMFKRASKAGLIQIVSGNSALQKLAENEAVGPTNSHEAAALSNNNSEESTKTTSVGSSDTMDVNIEDIDETEEELLERAEDEDTGSSEEETEESEEEEEASEEEVEEEPEVEEKPKKKTRKKRASRKKKSSK